MMFFQKELVNLNNFLFIKFTFEYKEVKSCQIFQDHVTKKLKCI